MQKQSVPFRLLASNTLLISHNLSLNRSLSVFRKAHEILKKNERERDHCDEAKAIAPTRVRRAEALR